MINSSISECNHKYETRNAKPEIGTDGSSQTRQNPQVDGYRSGFGLRRVSASGFRTVLEPNRPIFAVHTRTAGGLAGPIANTTPLLLVDPLLHCLQSPYEQVPTGTLPGNSFWLMHRSSSSFLTLAPVLGLVRPIVFVLKLPENP